jgi:cellobiose phosphorylase
MQALDQRLVRREHGLVQLLDPPFDKSSSNPGYIKGYVPGVRENGGQYTHAAIWAAMAFAELGDSRRAWELLAMINPVNHGNSAAAVATYKVEPYVIAADVYAVSPHTGRGGWTWYTGSAGWLYRAATEAILGIRKQGNTIHINPVIPTEWNGFAATLRLAGRSYRIEVSRQAGVTAPVVEVDGKAVSGAAFELADGDEETRVAVRIGSAGGGS